MTPYLEQTPADRAALLEADPYAWVLHRHYANNPSLTAAEALALVHRVDTTYLPVRRDPIAQPQELDTGHRRRQDTDTGTAPPLVRLANSLDRHAPPALRDREVVTV